MKKLALALLAIALMVGCAHTPRATTPLLVAGLLRSVASEIQRQAPGDADAKAIADAVLVLALWAESDEEVSVQKLRESIKILRGAGAVAERLGYDLPPHVLQAVAMAEIFLGGVDVR